MRYRFSGFTTALVLVGWFACLAGAPLGCGSSASSGGGSGGDGDDLGGQGPGRAGSASVQPDAGDGGSNTPAGGQAGETGVGGAEAAGGQVMSPLGPSVVTRSGGVLQSQNFRLRVSVGPLSPAPLRSAHFRLMLAAQPIDGGQH